MMNHQDIRIGTLAQASQNTPDYLRQILPHGFESFSLTFWQSTNGIDLKDLALRVKDVLGDKAIVSSLGLFGNPLQDEQTRREWNLIIDACHLFGCDIAAGFAGAIEGSPVPESISKFREVWGNWPGRRRMRASGSPLRIATWEEPGRRRNGISRIRRMPGN